MSHGTRRVTTRNATFQQWQALLGNRSKRHRAAVFVVQGVRPISLAVEHGWRLTALLYDADRRLSQWADALVQRHPTLVWALGADLMAELGEKASESSGSPPELVAVVAMPPDVPARIPVGPDFLGVVFDRPSDPGNLGSLVRSADAFGAHGLVVTGHAADPYDPRAVRASTGSLFALPVVRLESHREVLTAYPGARTVGLDERGTVALSACDLTRPTLLVVGNETTGLTRAWREQCDVLARIPIVGAASSLNAANAGTVALYEAARQRGRSS